MTGGSGHAQRWLHSVHETGATGDTLQPSDADDTSRSPKRWAAQATQSLLDAPVPFGMTSRVAPLGTPGSPGSEHDLESHLRAYGARPTATGTGAAALLHALDYVALSGRGGGHFPVASKWRAVLAAGGGGIIVANGAEGEPASVKDAAILQLRPHLVLDGLALAAEAMGAREAVVWLHEGDHATGLAVSRALAERRSAGDFSVVVRVGYGPNHYLSGESSTVVRALSGGPALPYLPRHHAAVEGIGGRPTLLHNAETLARVALLARTGPRAPIDGPLLTVLGRAGRVVMPALPDETFTEVLVRSRVVTELPEAVLVGGYGGSWLPWADVADLAVSNDALRGAGASLGAGVVAPLGAGSCGLTETARVLGYLAESSARQCGPCMFGLPAMAELVDRLAIGRPGRADLKTLDRYAAEVSGRGACHHPDGAVRLVRTALQTFATDVRRHVTQGPCPESNAPALLPIPEVI